MSSDEPGVIAARRCQAPIQLRSQLVERVWGGDRFSSTTDVPIGEAWLVHESNIVISGVEAGRRLADAVAACGESILGSKLWDAGERSFPLLVKLIDAREWLSIQVHPSDALARALEGPGKRGKSEAWYALDASPNTEIIAGVREGISQQELSQAIEDGSIASIVEQFVFGPDSVIALPAGTVHALGPGAFIYEIQQSSEITYRVFDWNRPQTAGRELHIAQSIRAADASLQPRPKHHPRSNANTMTPLVSLPQFTLVRAEIESEPLKFATRGEVFHLVTLISGEATLTCDNRNYVLSPFDTLLIPASAPPYEVSTSSSAVLLQGLPGTGNG